MYSFKERYDFGGLLIGLLGKAKSGKDTVANIVKTSNHRVRSVAFADPIKEFCKEVYEFSDEQLYGNLKDTPDPRYPRVRTAHFVKAGDYVGQSFPLGYGARPSERTPPRDIICGQCLQDICAETCIDHLTPREAYQTLGSGWGRGTWNDTWVNVAFRRAMALLKNIRVHPYLGEAGAGTTGKGSHLVDRCDLVFITDMRFVNEARAVKEVGGFVWRVTRPGAGLQGAAGRHDSEMDQESPEIDQYVDLDIRNDSTLAALEETVMNAYWSRTAA